MDFKEALTFRHACKVFDEYKIIEESDFIDILNAGVLAPRSMGLEPWEFEVVRDAPLREQIRKACWDQIQITSASELVVIYAKIADLRPNSEYVRASFARKTNKDENAKKAYLKAYEGFFERFKDERDIYGWAKAQCFLAAQNMMMQAAILGIDTCAIEGYDEKALNAVLGVNTELMRVAVILAFGFRIKPASPKIRQSLREKLRYR